MRHDYDLYFLFPLQSLLDLGGKYELICERVALGGK